MQGGIVWRVYSSRFTVHSLKVRTVQAKLQEGFRIRRASVDDAAQILSCLRLAFEPYRREYTPRGFADTVLSEETIGERLRLMSVFVAEEERGKVIGTVGCNLVNAEEGHIRGMAVLPEWQGRGVAAELLREAENELREKHCKRVTLDTTAPLKRAITFYERNGYRASGKIGNFFGMELFEYVKQL